MLKTAKFKIHPKGAEKVSDFLTWLCHKFTRHMKATKIFFKKGKKLKKWDKFDQKSYLSATARGAARHILRARDSPSVPNQVEVSPTYPLEVYPYMQSCTSLAAQKVHQIKHIIYY